MPLRIIQAPPEVQEAVQERNLLRNALQELQEYLMAKDPAFKPKHLLRKVGEQPKPVRVR